MKRLNVISGLPLLWACSSSIETNDEPEDLVIIEVHILAGGLTKDLDGVAADFVFGKRHCIPISSGGLGANFSCQLDLNAPDGGNEIIIAVAKQDFIAPEVTIPLAELQSDADRLVTVEIPMARDLRGDDWDCLQQGVVNSEPTMTQMSLTGAVEMEHDDPCQCYSLWLVMWEQTVSIIGDTIFGEQDIVFYAGQVNSNDSFDYLRGAKDDPDDGFQFVCAR